MNASILRTLGVASLLLLAIPNSQARQWSGLGVGASDWVYASTVYNGNLVIGGKFTHAGGLPANHVAMWNGSSWQALGAGFDADVWALTVYNGKLIAGGDFVFSGTNEVKFIAEWDGTEWIDLEGGMDSRVVALTSYNGSLIAGGYFHDANGPASNIARWDGHSWFPMGNGTNGTQGQVMALTVYGNDLIAGGFFSSAGGTPANHLAKWNGTTWSALGSGVNQIVYSLTTNNSKLAIGCLAGCYEWNGSSFTSLLSSGPLGGTYPYIMALASYGGNLFAGGLFTSIGGIQAYGMARWNGSEWSQVDSGFFGGGTVAGAYTLTPYANSLAAGGIFYSAGTVNSGNVAVWHQSFFEHGTGCIGSPGFAPKLRGFGDPAAFQQIGIEISDGKPFGSGLLFLATQSANVPIQGCVFQLGGILLPPIALPLDNGGARTVTTIFPSGVPSGTKIYSQFIGIDSGAPNGSFAASNDLLIVAQ